MPYHSRAEQERERWMTLLDAVAHIAAFDGCDRTTAQTQLIKALADGKLRPLKWEPAEGDKSPLPSLGSSMLVPDDSPPQGRAWSDAVIDWATGRVRDDFGEYHPGQARVPLLLRQKVARLWPPASVPSTRDPRKPAPLTSRRGPRPTVRHRVEQAMRDALRSGSYSADQLRSEKEVAMAALFGASRETCRKARWQVLAEISNAGDVGTTDK